MKNTADVCVCVCVLSDRLAIISFFLEKRSETHMKHINIIIIINTDSIWFDSSLWDLYMSNHFLFVCLFFAQFFFLFVRFRNINFLYVFFSHLILMDWLILIKPSCLAIIISVFFSSFDHPNHHLQTMIEYIVSFYSIRIILLWLV